MKTRSIQLLLISVAMLLGAACQSKGPAPKEASGAAPKVGTSETGGAHPGSANDPHAGMAPVGDPHAGVDMTQRPQAGAPVFGQPDAAGMVDLGEVAFKVPDGWTAQAPKSAMRRAQLSATGSAGPAELIVYFFGPQGAGTTQENIDRWVGQFSNPDGSPVSSSKQTKSKAAGVDVTRLEVAGQYSGGMSPTGQQQAAQANQRLIAAVVNTPGGPYYFKFLGPDATVVEQGAAFDELISSLVPSP